MPAFITHVLKSTRNNFVLSLVKITLELHIKKKSFQNTLKNPKDSGVTSVISGLKGKVYVAITLKINGNNNFRLEAYSSFQ